MPHKLTIIYITIWTELLDRISEFLQGSVHVQFQVETCIKNKNTIVKTYIRTGTDTVSIVMNWENWIRAGYKKKSNMMLYKTIHAWYMNPDRLMRDSRDFYKEYVT